MDIYFKTVITGITGRNVVICLILAIMIAVTAWCLCKRGQLTVAAAVVLPLFVSYLYLVLAITILDRTPGEDYQYEPELFWSYKEAMAGTRWFLLEILLNVVLFIPEGFCLSMLMKKRPLKSHSLSRNAACLDLMKFPQYIGRSGRKYDCRCNRKRYSLCRR